MKPGQVEKHNAHWICQLSWSQGCDHFAKIFANGDTVLERVKSKPSDSGIWPAELIAVFKVKKAKKPIDKVTTTNLDIACRMSGISISVNTLDKIIDLVELIEDKGDDVTIKDISKLQAEWEK